MVIYLICFAMLYTIESSVLSSVTVVGGIVKKPAAGFVDSGNWPLYAS